MEKKNTILLTVIAIATLLVAVVGATFAYFTASVSVNGNTTDKTQTVIKSATLGVVYTAGDKVALGLDGSPVYPGSASNVTNNFDIENKGDYDIDVDINFIELENQFANDLDGNPELVYTLTYTSSADTNNPKTVHNVKDSSSADILRKAVPTYTKTGASDNGTTASIATVTIPAKTTLTFKILVEFLEKGNKQNQNNQGKSYEAKIDVEINGDNQFSNN